VTAARVILVSDTHLSPAAPEAEANWEAVLDLAAGTPPRHAFVAPDGLAQLTLTSDLPDPYHD